MFERFRGKSAEELQDMDLHAEDFTSTELEAIIYETRLSQNDRTIANRLYIHGETYERIAEAIGNIRLADMQTKSTSEKSVREHKDYISKELQKTCVRIIPYWTDDFEDRWLKAVSMVADYYKIKKAIQYV